VLTLLALLSLALSCQQDPSGVDAPARPPSRGELDGGWSRFRGPNGSGRLAEAGLPEVLDPKLNLVWRTALPPGHSSPVLWQERVYLTALDGEQLCTYCLDARDGRVIWRRVAPRPRKDVLDGRNHPASPTPVVSDLGVFVFFPEYGMLGYDLMAEELWRVPLGPFVNDYGMGASPILAGGLVLLACDQARDSYFVALDSKTGTERWRVARPEARSGHCTPIVSYGADTADGTPQGTVYLPGSFYLTAYDLASGAKRWAAPGLSFEMKSVPILVEGRILINGYGSPLNQPGNQITVPPFAEVVATNDADADGRISEREMPQNRATSWFPTIDLDRDTKLDADEWVFLQRALASQNGLLAFPAHATEPTSDSESSLAPLWAYRRPVPQLPSLLYDGKEVVYMLADSGGLLTVIDPRDGTAHTTVRIAAAIDTYYASPVMSKDRVYVVSEHGLTCVLPTWQASPALEPLSVIDLGENVYATPALAPGRVYLRTTAALYCFGQRP
jgi:outer membrane protein assembly factor BamB